MALHKPGRVTIAGRVFPAAGRRRQTDVHLNIGVVPDVVGDQGPVQPVEEVPGHLFGRPPLAARAPALRAAEAAALLAAARREVGALKHRVLGLEQGHQDVVGLDDGITVVERKGQD